MAVVLFTLLILGVGCSAIRAEEPSTYEEPIRPSTNEGPFRPSTSTYERPLRPPTSTYGRPFRPSTSTYGRPFRPSTSTYERPFRPPTSTYGRPFRPSTSTQEKPEPPSTFEKPEPPSTFEKPEPPSTFEKPAPPSADGEPIEIAPIPVEVIDSNNMLTPIDQILNHPFVGSYIDQVAGNDELYGCQPEIVFVVDMSTSVGALTVATQTMPFIRDVLRRVAFLPMVGEGTEGFKHNVQIVTFNKKATLHTISLKGASIGMALRNIGNELRDTAVKGGSCISCGLELAAETLAKVRRIPGLQNKFIILVSDGHDHDGLNSNNKTPVEVSTTNIDNQISQISVAVSGIQKVPYNEPQLTEIAKQIDMFFIANTSSKRSSAVLNIVDLIAGRTCMQLQNQSN